jgi:ArsR family metal-binding transcriptional regulator
MYLDSISLIQTLPCLAEPGKLIIIGKPSGQLGEVLPYLATLPGVIAYNPSGNMLAFRRYPGLLTLNAERVYITQVKDVEEGLELLAALKEAINTTWEHRHELPSVTKPRHTPRPLDVWELLPRTNCGLCGEATCMAFACNILLHTRLLDECPVLLGDEAFADRRSTLQALV